ncbi:TetR family transcriptional regulator [Acinetobacter gerneri]|uniref:TetR family transcriptional regulator n=1 Tax=Acinetobacter gerneri TaxID=202952 RepID=A0AAW8JQU9_9GAMM|nr:TetR family transcriptional regulator [Acinetobacter gerneri]MDQ9010681.1 TetR family transcriptional regulator [Acinetobacter gerneri]MDQ9014887.1 TetR family transcriptional regulator [Acinetobacter gerneri]MDQ9026051.1 TetR family transcriptional regulator [Acinetobacter gerneri]MDQ9053339.1 TetR family transcriptional regulator [Acinetobacter gerneri]MDQ9060958.1 TetR family transcriptional regulator [Acinetobacter gerneri]
MSIRDERKQQSRQALLTAALHLSTSGRSFSNLSLRELSREVGLVPTAFYRHFQDLNALGIELVDQVALNIKTVLYQLGQGYLAEPQDNTRQSIERFFNAVSHDPLPWKFMISERWGGSSVIRQAIAREVDFLIADLGNALTKMASMKHIQQEQDLKVLATILINISLTWAMSWINLQDQYQDDELERQQQVFIEQALTQLRLMFRGILNWQRE